MHGASSHPNPRNVASLRSRNQVRFSCLISDSSLLLTSERRFAPTTVRYRRISVRYESEQVSAFIGIRTSDLDVLSLRSAGYEVHQTGGDWKNPVSFRKAKLIHGGEELEIDWAADCAFRFFPIEPDPVMGWRLHLFDMATNKALALAARSVTRDYVDIVELDRTYPLEAIVWAACGKDQGFSPMLLLEMMRRFARINPRQLETIQARQLDPVALKRDWIMMSDRADAEITRIADTLPEIPLGVAFVDGEGLPGWIGRDSTLQIHRPTVRGCWPRVIPGSAEG